MELLAQLAIVVVALSPLLSLVAIPALTAWRNRRRALVVSYQVELTDAIPRELARAGRASRPLCSKALLGSVADPDRDPVRAPRDRSTRPRGRPAHPGPDARPL
jgi:hypothetical protein